MYDIETPDVAHAPGQLSDLRAGLGRRILAGTVDAVLVLIGVMVAVAVAGAISPEPAPNVNGEQPARPVDLVIVAVILLVPLLFGMVEARSGRSPGKRLLGVRVVGLDGRPSLGLATATKRSVLRWVSAVPLLAGYLTSIRDPHGLAWHDRWTQTAVVPNDVTIEPVDVGARRQTVTSPLLVAPPPPPLPPIVGAVPANGQTAPASDVVATTPSAPATDPAVRPSDAELADIERVELELVEQGAIDIALVFSFALRRWSDSPDRTVWTARLLHAEGYRSQAMAMLNDVIDADPEHAAAFALRAEILASLEQVDAARVDARRAHELDPADELSQLAAAVVALHAGDPDARPAVARFLADHPDDWLDLVSLGELVYQRNQPDLALALVTGAEQAGAPDHETQILKVRSESRIPFEAQPKPRTGLLAMWPSAGELRLLQARVEMRMGGDRRWSPLIQSNSYAARLPGLRRLWPLLLIAALLLLVGPVGWLMSAIVLTGTGFMLAARSRARGALSPEALAWIDYLADLDRLARVQGNRNAPARLKKPRVDVPSDSVEASPAGCHCERTVVLRDEPATAYANYHLARVRDWPGVNATGFRCSTTGVSWVAAPVGDTTVLRRCAGLDLAAVVSPPAVPGASQGAGAGGYL